MLVPSQCPNLFFRRDLPDHTDYPDRVFFTVYVFRQGIDDIDGEIEAMAKWLIENCQSPHTFAQAAYNAWQIVIADPREAMAFKLRWM